MKKTRNGCSWSARRWPVSAIRQLSRLHARRTINHVHDDAVSRSISDTVTQFVFLPFWRIVQAYLAEICTFLLNRLDELSNSIHSSSRVSSLILCWMEQVMVPVVPGLCW